jgi:selenocysteine lyase/cysteine desulfurase
MLSSYPDISIDVMPVDQFGRVEVEAAKAQAHPATKLVMLTWCPATCGIFHPAEAVGSLAEDLGAIYIVDACQVAGQRTINVRDLRCHGLAASGRKWLRGPRGTALLFASRDYLANTRPFMPDQFGEGRTDARRYETGEANVAGKVGLSVALRALQSQEADVITRQLTKNAETLRTRIGVLPGITIVEQGTDLAAFVALTGLDVPRTVAELAREGITVSSPGRAYAPLDMDARGLSSVIRIAPHVFHTGKDIDALVKVFERVAVGRSLR